MCGITQRQAISDQRERGQIELVGLNLAPGWRFSLSIHIHKGCISARPLQTVARAELQVFGCHIKTVGKMPPGKTPAHGL